MSLEFNGRPLVGRFQLDNDVSKKLLLAAADLATGCQVQDLEEPLNAFFLISLLKKSEETENTSP
jgi:hypothetical protein